MITVAPGFTLARTKASIDLAELSARSPPGAAAGSVGTGIEVFPAPSSGFGLACAAINHLDRTRDEDFAGGPGLEKGVAGAEGNFRLIRTSTTPSRRSGRSGSIIERRS